MQFYIDPLTGRPTMAPGPGGPGMMMDLGVGPDIRTWRQDRYQTFPPSPRQYLGPGDGAPDFSPSPDTAPPVTQTPVDTFPRSFGEIPDFGRPPSPRAPQAMDDPAAGMPSPRLDLASDPSLPVPPTPPAQTPTMARQARPGALLAPTMQPDMTEGEIDAFSVRMGGSESGNRFDAMNPGGYAGRVQFGAPRLQTLGVYTPGQGENMREWGAGGGTRTASGAWSGTFNIPGFPEVRTVEDFRRNPAAQRAVERAHWADIDQAIDNTPGAENFDRNGLRAVAQLGGNGGMRRFIESGGQYDPADGNGTRLSAYYRRFAGTDAPNGLQARQGGQGGALDGATATPLSAELPTQKPDAAPADAVPAEPGDRSFYGVPANALLAAGAAMLGGRNPQEGLANAGQAFVRQANTDRQFEAGRLDRAEARADRRTSQAELAAYRRAQLAVQQQRVDQARQNGGAATPYSFDQTTYRAEDGSLYRQRANRATGAMEWVNQRNEVVPPDRMPERLTRVQDTGERTLNDGVARDASDAAQSAFNAEASLRTLRQATANARQMIRDNPNLTGPSWRQQGGRYLAQALGVQIDGKSPDEIAAIEQALMAGQTQQIIQMGQHLRPMSNVDLQAVLRQVPSVMSDPRLLPAWLDQIDQASARAERATRAFDELWRTPAGRRAIVDAGGVDAWFARYHRENSPREPGASVPPNMQRTGQPGQPGTWQAIQPGERRELPGGVVIQRRD